jgi:probable addiction module antidote protein
MALETFPYDTADYLDNDETISGYLTEAFEADDPSEAIQALNDVARARGGLERLARLTGLAEADLKTALGSSGNPDYFTLHKILQALGAKVSVTVTTSATLAA